MLYWKCLLKETGLDWTDIERMTNYRKGWKKVVKGRMERVHVWEKQKGHKYGLSEGED